MKNKKQPFKLKKPTYAQTDDYSIEAGVLTYIRPVDGVANIPEGVSLLKRPANLNLINKLVTPSSLTEIAPASFIGSKLIEIDMSKSTNLEIIPEKAFGLSILLEKVTLPNGLIAVAPAAFYSTAKLKEIYIPSSVATIGVGAFGASGLSKITTDNAEKLKATFASEAVSQKLIDIIEEV